MATVHHMARVQSADGQGDPASATFGATPAEGNLLIVHAMERSGNSQSTYTISGAGWTKDADATQDVVLANTVRRRTHIVWYKVAGASEPTNIQVDNGTTATKKIIIEEYRAEDSGNSPITVTWTREAAAAANNGTTQGAESQTTGVTASVSAADLLLWAYLDARQGPDGFIDSHSWTNSLGTTIESEGGANGRYMCTAFVLATIAGTKESTVTINDTWSPPANTGLSAGIMVFSAAQAGGGLSIPVAMNSYRRLRAA